jgi:hypothetical protein
MLNDTGDRTLVKEFCEGNVVIEVWEKKDGARTFYDIRHMREYTHKESGERKRSAYIQQRDIRHDLKATLSAMEYIADRHRELRGATGDVGYM